MTSTQAQLCERLSIISDCHEKMNGDEGDAQFLRRCRDEIESQAKQITTLTRERDEASAAEDKVQELYDERAACAAELEAKVQQQALEYVSLFDQCSEALDRVKALEVKCALMAASLAQAEREKDDAEKHAAEVSNANFELESKVAAAEKATRFAGLVLAQHRNDGYPGDVDGDDLQRFALESGMIEERLVESSCGSECSCADVGEFPTTCYFNTEAGKAAIAASEEQS